MSSIEQNLLRILAYVPLSFSYSRAFWTSDSRELFRHFLLFTYAKTAR